MNILNQSITILQPLMKWWFLTLQRQQETICVLWRYSAQSMKYSCLPKPCKTNKMKRTPWISLMKFNLSILFSWAHGDCSHEMKRHLLLGRKAVTNLDRVLKSRAITLLTKVRTVKAMVFPVATCGCESWTINKAEHRRINALELWCWKRLFRVPWTGRRSNQSILKEIKPEYLLEGLMLQYSGHLKQRANSLEKTPMLGLKVEGKGMTEDEMLE